MGGGVTFSSVIVFVFTDCKKMTSTSLSSSCRYLGPQTAITLTPAYFICPKECEKHSSKCIMTNNAKQPHHQQQPIKTGQESTSSSSTIQIKCPGFPEIAYPTMRGGQFSEMGNIIQSSSRPVPKYDFVGSMYGNMCDPRFMAITSPEKTKACCTLAAENVTIPIS